MTFDQNFAIHSSFLLPSFLGGKRKGKRITKVVVKSHAFLLDHTPIIGNVLIVELFVVY